MFKYIFYFYHVLIFFLLASISLLIPEINLLSKDVNLNQSTAWRKHPLCPFHSQFCLLLRLAGHIALDLGLVHSIHGKPNQSAPETEGPKGIAASRVQVETGKERCGK